SGERRFTLYLTKLCDTTASSLRAASACIHSGDMRQVRFLMRGSRFYIDPPSFVRTALINWTKYGKIITLE
ncbi:MAG TPA: hypothetical protein PLW17_10625, partial [Limnochordia bacterium]|nr:hypothetical protein [Limnochordia bacterium]